MLCSFNHHQYRVVFDLSNSPHLSSNLPHVFVFDFVFPALSRRVCLLHQKVHFVAQCIRIEVKPTSMCVRVHARARVCECVVSVCV